jgi:hypothetical protein
MKKPVTLPKAVDDALTTWWDRHASTVAPESLRQYLAAALEDVKRLHYQRGRRHERSLWSRE